MNSMTEQEVINDAHMAEVIHADLREHFGFDNKQAKLFIENHAETIVDAMWTEYSAILESIVTNSRDN